MMRRKLLASLSAVLIASVAMVLAPARPAAADVCAAPAIPAAVPAGLLGPVNPPQIELTGQQLTILFPDGYSAGVAWSLTGGVCTGGGTVAATGTLQGYCGHSTGTGTSGPDHLVAWTSIGTFLILTHEVTGVVSAIPDPTITGNSCIHGGSVLGNTLGTPLPSGALTFIVTGAVWRVNCTVEQLQTTLVLTGGVSTLTDIPHQNLPHFGLVSNIHVTIPGAHAHVSVHECILPTPL